jgi:hypothetical protein
MVWNSKFVDLGFEIWGLEFRVRNLEFMDLGFEI